MLNKPAHFSRNTKRALLVAIDFIALPIALLGGFVLRVGSEWLQYAGEAWWLFIAAPVVAVPVFIRFGLYRAVLRYVGSKALLAIAKALTIVTLTLLAFVVMLQTQGVPRSVFFSFWLISILFIAGSRLFLRDFILPYFSKAQGRQPVAVYGAGSAGAELVKAMQSGVEYEPVVMIDDAKEKQGTEIHGVKVYSAEQLADLREVDIADVLGREVVPPVPHLLEKCIRGKNVLVTGAGGSIGSELCRQIVKHGASVIVLFEQSEFALYAIEKELKASNRELKIIPILGSVTHMNRVIAVLKSFSVHTVYHAAAYKHVPLVEQNPMEGLQNNVFGTWRTAEAAMRTGVETFVLVSTDKAVRPTNIMGATKRFAELVLQGMADEDSPTRFVMVRFGNVLDSSGSVIPLFREQIKNSLPVTVTHPDITRYFMTLQEASQLVLQAGALGEGGDVFVLDMGEPIKIDDLARNMIRLSGLDVCDESNPGGDITIEYTGLRSGEKLYEELLIGDNVSATQHPKIMRAAEEKLSWEQLVRYRSQLEEARNKFETKKVKSLLSEAVSGYTAEKEIVDPVWNELHRGEAEY